MTQRPQPEPPPPAPRLYLVAPPVHPPSDLAQELDRLLGIADVAAVLLRLAEGGERTLIDAAKTIAPVVQGRGVALLLDGHAELVARAGADGTHLTGIEAFTAALDGLKPQWIVGAGGLRSRHDAMLAAERGADYVMFGEPDGRRPGFDQIIERVSWWAELFEPPCVGYAANLDEVTALATAGADFVAIGELVFSDSQRACSIVEAAAGRLAQVSATASPRRGSGPVSRGRQERAPVREP